MVAGEMGELALARGITNGVDAPVGGFQPSVDDDPAVAMGDASVIEAEAVGVDAAASRDQEVTALDRFLPARNAQDRSDPRAGMLDAHDLDAGAQADPLALERIQHDRCAFVILARQRLRRLQHGHLRAEAMKGLR